jgi:hypothetical protein
MIYIIIYVVLGLLPSYINAKKEYENFSKNYNPSLYEVRYKWIANSIENLVFGLSFIISLILWPLVILESTIKKIWEKIKNGRNK